MKLLSLFDGSGGFPLAASMCGINPVQASEIEPYPIAVTRSRFPNMKHLGDVSKINGADLEPVDIITFGSPCFPKGTLVLTNKGYVEIENIKIGDVVFTHQGNWKKVSAVGSKTSETVTMKGHHYGLVATPNHPFFSATNDREWNGHGYTRKLADIGEWTRADEMEGKRWAVPNTIKGISIPLIERWCNKQSIPPEINEDLMYVVGRWLGDGWLRDGQRPDRPEGDTFGTIIICANDKEVDVLEQRMAIVFPSVSKAKERTVCKCKVNSQSVCKWLRDNFGEYAHSKTLPSWVYCMDKSMRAALLQGYMDSDGWMLDDHTYKITTVSKKLAHSIRLLGETLGYSCTIHFNSMPPTTEIEGRTVNQRDNYQVVLRNNCRTSSIVNADKTWYRCKEVTENDGEQTVYNITVEDDHSYVVEGFVVHNCQDLSVAGNRAGLQHEAKGDEETTRSGLFIEAIRIIKEMRDATRMGTDGIKPRIAVWENVPGAFSSNKGEDFRIVLEEFVKVKYPTATLPAPDGKWPYADIIMADGFSLAYRVLDAQYWGVPQRRKRIYLVADFDGERAGEVLFESQSLRGHFTESRQTREETP